MKEQPILFSGDMVRAVLSGTKTQTRRVVKPVKHPDFGNLYDPGQLAREQQHVIERACPCGRPGDRLWVRETFAIEHSVEPDQLPPHGDGRPVKWRPADDYDGPLWQQPHYRATDPAPELLYEDGPAGSREDAIGVRWQPSVHMPRWASRILLEITDVRVERLQDISEADAVAEGAPVHLSRYIFCSLWQQINGAGSWDANPWVWVIGFKRVEGMAA